MPHADSVHDEKPWRDEQTVRELYERQGLSTYEVADELGCSYQTVHDWLNKHNIDTRDSPTQKSEKTKPGEDTLKEMYQSGMRLSEIADKYDVATSTVWCWVQEYGIETRRPAAGLEGEESYSWKPPDEMVDREYDPIWRKRRVEVIEEQSECARCGMTREEHQEQIGRDITVHHIKKAREFDDPEKAHKKENLVVLCLPCHVAIDNYNIPIDVRHKQQGCD